MLQTRIFSYEDAHRYRLGVNYESLPVNRSKVEVNTYNRDGLMRFDGNEGKKVIYEPNSFGGPKENLEYKEPPLKISGDATRYDQLTVDDDYIQPGNLYRLLPSDEKARLIKNIVNSLRKVPEFIQKRMINHFTKADTEWGKKVAE
ncbi:MAG: catalase-related domain-containing protein [Candidatus Helarchaeota archaeon]